MIDNTVSHAFEIDQLQAGYPESPVLDNISLSLPRGKLTAVVGPNGCGKSTLLKCLSRLLPYTSGEIKLDGVLLKSYARKSLATTLTSLPQYLTIPKGITVFDLVARGRTPYQGLFHQWSKEDQIVTEESIEQVNLSGHAGAVVEQLSGGQRQRAWIAMTLAQRTQTLLLDEPTASLDPLHQLEVFILLRDLCRRQGKTVVVVVHDLSMALQFADYVAVLRQGRVVSSGDSRSTMTPEIINEAFGLTCEIVKSKSRDCYAIIPIV